jgi:hypothetical protein
MLMKVELGILLALVCGFATNLSFLLKHRGACAAPEVEWKHPVRSALGLWASRWFMIGMLVAGGALGLHVAAIALAPLSLVQAVISAGLVFLTVLAERVFGVETGRSQVLGVGLMSAGLVLLVITLPATSRPHAEFSVQGMIGFESALLLGGTALLLSPRLGALDEHHGPLLGAASGMLFGVADVGIKALTGVVGRNGLLGLASPWLLVIAAASVIAFYASARGLQTGDAIPVITLTGAAANVSAILGGIVVFGDPVRSDPLGIVLQSLAFALVIAAAVAIPGPVRAARRRTVAA